MVGGECQKRSEGWYCRKLPGLKWRSGGKVVAMIKQQCWQPFQKIIPQGALPVFKGIDANNLPPKKWIIKDLFAANTINLVYGEAGSGKSYFFMNFAAHAAAGIDWLGYKVKETPVLWVDADMGHIRTLTRADEVQRGICEFYDLDPKTKGMFDAFHIVTYESFAEVKANPVNLYTGDGLDYLYLTAAAKFNGSGIIVLDSFSTMIAGANENAQDEMQIVMSNIITLRNKTNAAIFLIHHQNKANSQYRGSTVIKASSDNVFKVEKVNGSFMRNIDGSSTSSIKFSTDDKFRDSKPTYMELTQTFDFRTDIPVDYSDPWSAAEASYVYDSDGNEKTKYILCRIDTKNSNDADAKKEELKNKIYQYIFNENKKNFSPSQNGIASAVSGNKKTIISLIGELINEGKIIDNWNGKKGAKHSYLTKEKSDEINSAATP